MRDFLIERGIRPEEAALAVIYPDDVTVLTAVVVADAQRMFEIDLEYPAGVDKGMAMSESRIASWRDDAARIVLENRDFVQAALDVLSRGGCMRELRLVARFFLRISRWVLYRIRWAVSYPSHP